MGGKGKKRREKNYRAAHGDNSRLPAPPVPSSIDALPTKLRQLMKLTSQGNDEHKVQRTNDAAKSEADIATKRKRNEKEDDNVGPNVQNINSDDANVHDSSNQKKKKKRKKTQVNDLRFAAEMEKLGVRSSKRERKKEYFKAKKNKNKKAVAEDILYAPKKDVVKFGDIVQAPPKLAVVPKAPKKPIDASQERLQLKAIEAYRSRRQWASRPGVHVPSTIQESPSAF